MSTRDLTHKIQDYLLEPKIVLRPYQLVSDVHIFLQISRLSDRILYFYVVDEEDHLIGVVSSRKLVLSPVHESISSIMDTDVVALHEDSSLEQALELFTHHQLLAFPVVDHKKKLKGFIDVQTVLGESFDAASTQRKTDLFQMVGIHLEEARRKSVLKGYLARMPWLFCNLFGGFACAMISDFFEAVLAKYLVLAMFIPLVLSLSESVTMQTVMQSLLLMRKSSMPLKKHLKMFIKDLKVVFFVGLTCALIVSLMSPFWGEGYKTSWVMGLGIFIAVIVSSSFGSFFPILLHRNNLDPKIASGPVALMLADVATTIIYLFLASFFLL